MSTVSNEDIDLIEAWKVLWSGKWLIIGITTLFGLSSVAYALTLTHWYRAEVLLAPTEQRAASSIPAQLGGLAGLAGLAGINVSSQSQAEALAVLESRDFTREFIEDKDLMKVLFAARWDPEAGTWLDPDPANWPDLREAVRYFNDVIRDVDVGSTGMVTLAIEWPDPELAAEWANLLVERLNDYMRARALREAQSNFDYLQKELAATNVVALQQSIGRLLENELQRLMLARGNEEFAFRVIDRAEAPIIPSRPQRRLIVILATVFGGALSVFLVLVRHFVVRQRSAKSGATTA